MSRVGLSAIDIPEGVSINNDNNVFSAKGKIGELTINLNKEINVQIENSKISFSTSNADNTSKALWGTTRANVANLIKGVSEGFTIKMEINGVGYRAQIQGNKIVLNLGYSHPVEMAIPKNIKVTSEKPTELILFGADKQELGQFAANIRSKRPPEPFKGKGVKYANEHIFRKEGKKK